MNCIKFLCVTLFFLVILTSCTDSEKAVEKSSTEFPLLTLEDSVSYLLGMGVSAQFKFFNEKDYRPEMVELGLRDVAERDAFKLTNDEKKEVMTDYFQWARKYRADSILSISYRFLNNNKSKSGVKETPRGLQYEILKEGSSTQTADGNDVVKAFYKQGTALKGILIDPSDFREENDTSLLALNGLYSGVSEALQMMNPGDHWRIWVTPRIGSNEGEDLLKVVEPNEVLYAEIELLEIISRSHNDFKDEFLTKPGYFIDESRRFE